MFNHLTPVKAYVNGVPVVIAEDLQNTLIGSPEGNEGFIRGWQCYQKSDNKIKVLPHYRYSWNNPVISQPYKSKT